MNWGRELQYKYMCVDIDGLLLCAYLLNFVSYEVLYRRQSV